MQIYYTAYFVDEPQKLIELYTPKHSRVIAHHSTIQYMPKDLLKIEVGKKTTLKIIGRAFDDKGDVLIVENPKSEKKYPHITLSCAEGISASYSDRLLEEAYKTGMITLFDDYECVAVTEGYLEYKDGPAITTA